VGYTGFINDVDNTYMHDYFKLAAATARSMRNDTSSPDRFIYTTHTWLMERFLNCPCPEKRTPPSSGPAGVYTDATGAWRLYLSEVDERQTFKLQCAHSSKLTVSCSHPFSQSYSVPYVWMIRLDNELERRIPGRVWLDLREVHAQQRLSSPVVRARQRQDNG